MHLLAKGLRRWQNLEECLIHELCRSNGLYSADLVFNVIWGPDGRVRQRVLEEPRLLTLRLTGIEHFTFVGALTEGMTAISGADQLGSVRGRWSEGCPGGMDCSCSRSRGTRNRHLEATCVSIELIEPDG